MKRKNFLAAGVFAAALVISFAFTAAAQTANEGALANVVGGGSGARWEFNSANAGGTLTITFPDGRSVRKTFKAGGSPQIALGEKYFENLPDGVYFYELQLSASAAQKEAAAKSRGKDDDPESDRAARKPAATPLMIQSGSFAVVNGSIITAGAVEPQKQRAKASVSTGQTISGDTIRRVRSHHFSLFAVPDQVIPDDLIVQGSACVGLDCVSGEVFGFDTIRTKENNTRIQFDDTSTSAGFPTNNWQIRANSSASGGASFLGFVDQGSTGNSETGTIVFEVDAGAPANSLKVSSGGNVGLGTATPVLDMHINTGDTPAIRLEQNNTGGFTAQTWDVAGNEANFFVRDVTSGSRLPFRIRPGARTSSIDIAATSRVGIGTASPNTTVDIKQLEDTFLGGIHLRRAATNDTWALVTGADNNLYMGYATDASLADAATDFTIFPLVVTANNRVGVRTTAPDQALSVNGDASKTGGGSWQSFSDERLKNIQGRFNRGLNAVMQLQPLRYEYKPNNALGLKSEGSHVGFSAQSLQAVIPEAVTANDRGYLMVNNDPILWTMLNAIKEQQKQIDGLKGEVRRLRAAARRHRR